jgi:2-keto-3-deoxy-L-rhamnonate aldolase RhmA
MVQIEHRDAVENLDEILAVPHLSGIAIGRADLSASMGYTGQWDHPEIARVVEGVVQINVRLPKGMTPGQATIRIVTATPDGHTTQALGTIFVL